MAEFRLTAEAKADLRDIAFYTEAVWGRDQRNAYIHGLEDMFARLAHMPGLGRRRDDIVKGVLSHPARRHVIWYRPVAGGIEILRVLHERRSAERAFPGGAGGETP
ncbi:MAG: type II toxin-antitoxin system RelE/ParE family toxin [Maricaulaceae bacterium]|nr:type II toxin-antitoxin system RelE/ParE family toxin [Maricaulaceae bacterium]